jgi:hypothetical protein
MRKTTAATITVLLIMVLYCKIASAGPQSDTYELKEYGFASAGTEAEGSDSTTYTIFATAGEVDNGSIDSTSFRSGNGLTYTMQANVPAAPTFTNPGSNYDRLKFVLDDGDNPTDTTFAIAISDDDFVTTRYVQDDLTIGNTLGAEDWQSYASWGGASGSTITGLAPNKTYKIKAKAVQGDFTESGWSAEASAATIDSTLTFGVDSAAIEFNDLGPSNSYTDSSKTTILTTSTNAYNGYVVYGWNTQPLTNGSNTIAAYGSSNASPTTWSGTGFGYSTNDSDLSGGTADRFTNGGPKYAGFGTSGPGDPVADHAGPVTTPISSEQFTISYRVTGNATTRAGTYDTTVIYTVSATY